MRKELPKYPKYKDSGVEWLGEVPECWQKHKLRFAVRFRGGGTPSKDNLDYWRGDIPWVSPKDMKTFKIDDAEDHVNNSAIQESATNLIEPGNVLMVVRSGILRRCIPVATNTVSVALNQDMKAMKPRKGLLSEYLMLLIHSNEDALLILWRKHGATVESIEESYIANTWIAIPPLDEQRAIVAFLDAETGKIDRLMGVRRKQIEVLREQRAAVIHHAVTQGLDPTAPMKDSGIEWLGKIPAHWEVLRLGNFASVKARLGWKGLKAEEYVETGNILLATPNIKGEEVEFDNVNYITDERYLESPEIKLRIGDVLLVKDGATLGIVNMVKHLPAPATLNSSIALIRVKKSCSPSYLKDFLKSSYFQNVIQQYKGGMGVPHLFQADIVKFSILLPLPDEQEAIVAHIDRETAKIDALIVKYERELALLEEYRASLISHAVTGKIDVRGVKDEGAMIGEAVREFPMAAEDPARYGDVEE